MRNQESNPPLPPLLRGVTLVVVAVLLAAGGGLFFLPEAARQAWPWALAPFDELFLGAVFLASLAAVGMLLVYPRWAPARLLLPMLFAFSAVFLLVSLADPGRFQFERWSTWGWFALFAALPVMAGYGLWRYRDLPSPVAYPTTPPRWRRVLLFGLGLALIGWSSGQREPAQ